MNNAEQFEEHFSKQLAARDEQAQLEYTLEAMDDLLYELKRLNERTDDATVKGMIESERIHLSEKHSFLTAYKQELQGRREIL